MVCKGCLRNNEKLIDLRRENRLLKAKILDRGVGRMVFWFWSPFF
jgi:hypothetical protein